MDNGCSELLACFHRSWPSTHGCGELTHYDSHDGRGTSAAYDTARSVVETFARMHIRALRSGRRTLRGYTVCPCLLLTHMHRRWVIGVSLLSAFTNSRCIASHMLLPHRAIRVFLFFFARRVSLFAFPLLIQWRCAVLLELESAWAE
jgi:hypothetical protein